MTHEDFCARLDELVPEDMDWSASRHTGKHVDLDLYADGLLICLKRNGTSTDFHLAEVDYDAALARVEAHLKPNNVVQLREVKHDGK